MDCQVLFKNLPRSEAFMIDFYKLSSDGNISNGPERERIKAVEFNA